MDLVNSLLPWTTVLMGIAIFCLIIGGLLVFFGVKTRFGAFLLILFILGATFVFHAFWMFPPEEKSLQMTMFMQHVAILGGLLTLLALGNGTCKKSAPKSKEE
jgi:putative oxidoreductase